MNKTKGDMVSSFFLLFLSIPLNNKRKWRLYKQYTVYIIVFI